MPEVFLSRVSWAVYTGVQGLFFFQLSCPFSHIECSGAQANRTKQATQKPLILYLLQQLHNHCPEARMSYQIFTVHLQSRRNLPTRDHLTTAMLYSSTADVTLLSDFQMNTGSIQVDIFSCRRVSLILYSMSVLNFVLL